MIPPSFAQSERRAVDSPGLSRKRFGAPSLGLGSLQNISNLALPGNESESIPRTKKEINASELNDKNVRKDSKYQFQVADLQFVRKLGQGTGGQVSQVLHLPTGIMMARKVINMGSVESEDSQKKIEKQVIRELKILRLCSCPYIVAFYGAFLEDVGINIMMEFMDFGTLESLYQKNGPIPETYVSVFTSQLLQGLIYLYEQHKIVHRDIKPSNILFSSSGHAKIADFGVSKETAETLAMTFIGTQCFLAPERIREGSPCTPASDVWALGLAMMEIAMAKFPFPQEVLNTAFDIFQFIVQEPSPTLPKDMFSSRFEEFCSLCLLKDPQQRPHPRKLMEIAFIQETLNNQPDLKSWIATLKQ